MTNQLFLYSFNSLAEREKKSQRRRKTESIENVCACDDQNCAMLAHIQIIYHIQWARSRIDCGYNDATWLNREMTRELCATIECFPGSRNQLLQYEVTTRMQIVFEQTNDFVFLFCFWMHHHSCHDCLDCSIVWFRTHLICVLNEMIDKRFQRWYTHQSVWLLHIEPKSNRVE